ncbi:MAG: amidase family protein, partial [Gammaproteobacteria bacterium]|nr:amidase family protein [Gammaproteobacteria bacterium]
MAAELHRQTLTELAVGLGAGDFSARELTEALLGRIAKYQETLNAFITVTGDEALDAADRADEARAAGRAGPL